MPDATSRHYGLPKNRYEFKRTLGRRSIIRRGAVGYRRCRTWRCDFNIPIGKEFCPGCGLPTRLWRRVLVHLRIARRRPSLRPAEAEVWKLINQVQKEWQKLANLEGDLTGYHKPKMTPEQRAAIEKGEDQISRKAQPALQRLKEIEVARWQNGWIPVALCLADETLDDAQLAAIEEELYRHTRAGSALNKRWKRGIPKYEGLFTKKTKAMDPSVFRLTVTIIRIREWISARRTANALAEVSSFSDNVTMVDEIPSDDVSEWLEMIYDRDEQLQRLTDEALRLEAEEDVDRLLGSDP
jgi:hypothetical protein